MAIYAILYAAARARCALSGQSEAARAFLEGGAPHSPLQPRFLPVHFHTL